MPEEKSVPQHVYTRGGRAVVTGIPGDDHNCDEMSCPSVEHVLYRLPHSDDEKRDLFEIKAGCILSAESIQEIIDSPNFRDYEKAMAKEIKLHREGADTRRIDALDAVYLRWHDFGGEWNVRIDGQKWTGKSLREIADKVLAAK